jgi:hypothetical protein
VRIPFGKISHHLSMIKEVVVYLGIPLLIFMFMHYNIEVGKQTTATQDIVKSQGRILNAIQNATLDNRLNSDQKTNLIICMLQVPIAQRNTDVLTSCRNQAANTSEPTVLTPTPTSTSQPNTQAAPVTQNTSQNPTSTSTNNTTSGSADNTGVDVQVNTNVLCKLLRVGC